MSEPEFWQDSQDYQDYVIENCTLTENLGNLKNPKNRGSDNSPLQRNLCGKKIINR